MSFKKNNIGNSVTGIYKALFAIVLTDSLVNSFVPSTVIRGFELLCLLYACFQYIKLYRQHALIQLPKYLYAFLIAFYGISIYIITRGEWPHNLKDQMLLVISQSDFLVYILPILILRLPNKDYFSQILHLFFKATLFVIPIWLLNYDGLVLVKTDTPWAGEAIGRWMPFISAFLLGYVHRFTKGQKFFIYFIFVIYLFLMVLNARRNVSFSLVVYFAIAYIYKVIVYDDSSKQFIKITIAGIAVLAFFLSFDTLAESVFTSMGSRLKEDTRTGVEESMLLDFSFAPVEDWIWGRGMSGTYECITMDYITMELRETRNVIETGYLQMLLKGGIVYAVVIIILIILALMVLFRRKTNGDYYMGFILVTYLFDNYTTNPICIFSPRSILFWFIISYAFELNILVKNDGVN